MFPETADSFVLYVTGKLDQSAKEQLISKLEDEGMEFSKELLTKRDFNQWIRPLSDASILFITDAELSSMEVKQVLEKVSDSIIFCTHNEEVDAINEAKGNIIKAHESFEEILNLFYFLEPRSDNLFDGIEQDYEEEQQLDFCEETVAQMPESEAMQGQDEWPPLQVPNDCFEEELHPALANVTEFQSGNAILNPSPEDTAASAVETPGEAAESTEIEPTSENDEKVETAVNYTESPLHTRSRTLQQQLFFQKKWEGNRVIGVWSPLHRSGVTSFVMNFAFYLAEKRIFTVILEGLAKRCTMKDWLLRYSSSPTGWSSYASALQSDDKEPVVQWNYKNVSFLPLENGDAQLNWTPKTLEMYLTTPNIVDITLVDLETGEMAPYTRDSLNYLDELWIVVDDTFQETLSWKSYIQNLKEQYSIPLYLVFNKQYSFSQDKRLARELELPLLASIPSLHEETMMNYYENKPLYFQKGIQEKVNAAYLALAEHLFHDADFTVSEKIEKKWYINPLDPLIKMLKPLKERE